MNIKNLINEMVEEILSEKVSKIACLKCDEVSTAAAWQKKGGFCPKCKVSNQGVAESVELYERLEINKGETKEIDGKKYIGKTLVLDGKEVGKVYAHTAISQTKKAGSRIATSQKKVVRWGYRLIGIQSDRYALTDGYSSRDEAQSAAVKAYLAYMKANGLRESVELDEAGNKSLDPKWKEPAQRTAKEIKNQVRGFSDATLKKMGQETDTKGGFNKIIKSKTRKMQDKLVDSELRRRGMAEELGEAELTEMKQPYVVIDTADGNKVVAMASDEKGAKQSIASSERPPMSIKDKNTLKLVKARKKQYIGYPLSEEVKLDEANKNIIPDRELNNLVKSKKAVYWRSSGFDKLPNDKFFYIPILDKNKKMLGVYKANANYSDQEYEYLDSMLKDVREEVELDEQAMTFQNAEKLKSKHLVAMDHHKKNGNSKGYVAHSMVVRKFEDAYDRHGTGVIPAGKILAASQKAFKDYPHPNMEESVELSEDIHNDLSDLIFDFQKKLMRFPTDQLDSSVAAEVKKLDRMLDTIRAGKLHSVRKGR
jgi:hypothetical protein